MENQILFSIIMPTYNSENTIEKALKSIRMQDLPKECIEILVIDGGSTDRTIEIAKAYDAIILNNPRRFPEYAKRIGFDKARGRFAVMQDSDEVLTETCQLRKRKEFFEAHKDVHCLILDKYIPGENCGIACAYVNWFGDPFSYCIYNLSDSRIKSNKKYLKTKDIRGNIYYYNEDDVIPIGDGGTTTIDIEKAKELFGEEYFTQEFAVSIFYNMVLRTNNVGCIPEDNIVHYSVAGFRQYINKLSFRIYTNLNDEKQSGYSVRAKKNDKLKNRKIIFLFYCMSILLPLLDSVRMGIMYKKPSLLLHFFYTYYVVFKLCLEIVKKSLHIENKNIKYGK